MELKERHWVIFFLVMVIALCGYMYFKKTAPERKYKSEIKQLKLISEHQDLELEVALQRKDLEQLKKEAEQNMPRLNLTPPEEQNVD